ncbi:MAG: hypothetical protein N2595_01680, partial [bacterium]|nr:hypothetical protein [bacterium]
VYIIQRTGSPERPPVPEKIDKLTYVERYIKALSPHPEAAEIRKGLEVYCRGAGMEEVAAAMQSWTEDTSDVRKAQEWVHRFNLYVEKITQNENAKPY